jgi:hypothetical protein
MSFVNFSKTAIVQKSHGSNIIIIKSVSVYLLAEKLSYWCVKKHFYNDHDFIAIDLFNPYAYYYFDNFCVQDWAFFGKYFF